MRIFVVAAIAAAVLVVAIAQFAPSLFFSTDALDAEAERRDSRAIAAAQRVGAHRMLSSNDIIDLQMIVIGRAVEPNMLEFRGQASRERGLRPVYGRVETTCTDAFEAPECWTLALLEIDGQNIEEVGRSVVAAPDDVARQSVAVAEDLEVAPNATVPSGAAEGDDQRGDRSGDPIAEATVASRPIEAATDRTDLSPEGASTRAADDAPADLETAAVSSGATPPTQETASQEAASQETAREDAAAPEPTPRAATRSASSPSDFDAPSHRVANVRVNARSGPGRQYRVLAVLSPRTQLKSAPDDSADVLEEWGRYRVIDGENAGETVWLFEEFVEEAAQTTSATQ